MEQCSPELEFLARFFLAAGVDTRLSRSTASSKSNDLLQKKYVCANWFGVQTWYHIDDIDVLFLVHVLHVFYVIVEVVTFAGRLLSLRRTRWGWHVSVCTKPGMVTDRKISPFCFFAFPVINLLKANISGKKLLLCSLQRPTSLLSARKHFKLTLALVSV